MLLDDIPRMSQWISQALISDGYAADFSLASLKEIDRFFANEASGGTSRRGGRLSEHTGQKLFALGCYLGEVVIRAYGGVWRLSPEDPESEFDVEVLLAHGPVIWPMQRIVKRFEGGPENGIHFYGMALAPAGPEGSEP